MRTTTATERTNVSGQAPKCFAKLEITDSLGAYVDYTSGLLGPDFFNGGTLAEDQDASCQTLNLRLLRCSGTLSLSPFVASSALNLTTGSYATKLDVWRKWKISTAVSLPGYAVLEWKELGQGRVDVINVGDEEIAVTGRSEEAVLLDKWIDTERQYGSGGGIAMETVLQSMLDDNLGTSVVTLYTPVSPSYSMNAWTQPKMRLFPAMQAVAQKAGFVLRYRYDSSNVYRLTLFKPNRAAVASAGNEDWTLGPAEYTAVPLNKIDKSGVRNFIKGRYAHATLGIQTAIYPHMVGTGTLAVAAGVGTFSSSQAGIVRLDTRTNVIVAGIPYTISAFNGTTGCTVSSQLATGGVPTFAASAFTLSDTLSGAGSTTSLTRFDRNDLEIDLSYDTQVNDSTKAQAMFDAVGSDTEFPNLEQQFETIGFWFVQLHDYGRFLANGIHYDSDQFGGITSIVHDFSGGVVKTTLGARGKPSGAYAMWRGLGQQTVPIGPPSSQNRDTLTLVPRVTRVSETASQMVVRVAIASPKVGTTVSIVLDAGGLTVSPSTTQTITSTTDLSTTATIDYTITKDAVGGTQRRVAFTASAPEYQPTTDGVDVTPNSTRFRCKVYASANQGTTSGAELTPVLWDSEVFDANALHSTSVNTGRITVPSTGNTGAWLITAQINWDPNATGLRQARILKNGATEIARSAQQAVAGGFVTVQMVVALDDAPSAGDYYEVYAQQNSGGALNLLGILGNSFFTAIHVW